MKRLTGLLGCEIAAGPAPRCVGDAGNSPAPAAQVCARLTALGSPVTEEPGACPAAYATAQATTEPSDFARLTACDLAASDCAALSACQQACGPMDRAVRRRDASVDATPDATADVTADAATQDAPADAAPQDAPAPADAATEIDAPAGDGGSPDA